MGVKRPIGLPSSMSNVCKFKNISANKLAQLKTEKLKQ